MSLKDTRCYPVLLAVLTVLSLCITPLPGAEEPFSEETSEARIQEKAGLKDLIIHAYHENPNIQSGKEAWRVVVEKYRIVTAFPEPRIVVSYFPEPIETRLGPQEMTANLTWQIPFPGKLSKTGDIVNKEAEIARVRLDRAVRDIIVSLQQSYHELAYIREARGIASANLELLEHLRHMSETAHAQDLARLSDVIRAQSQSGQLRYDLMLLEDLEQTETAKMNALLNRPPGAIVGELMPLPFFPVVFSLEEIYDLAETHQEELRMATLMEEKAEEEIALAEFNNMPDFRVGLFYSSIGDPDVPIPPDDAGRDAVGIQFGFSVPLWFDKNQGRTSLARAKARKAASDRSARLNESHAQIRSTWFRLENAMRLATLYGEEMLPQATQSVELAEIWFREGEGNFTDLIEAQAVWYNFQLSHARARADYGQYLAQLERLAGRSLTVREATTESAEERP